MDQTCFLLDSSAWHSSNIIYIALPYLWFFIVLKYQAQLECNCQCNEIKANLVTWQDILIADDTWLCTEMKVTTNSALALFRHMENKLGCNKLCCHWEDSLNVSWLWMLGIRFENKCDLWLYCSYVVRHLPALPSATGTLKAALFEVQSSFYLQYLISTKYWNKTMCELNSLWKSVNGLINQLLIIAIN